MLSAIRACDADLAFSLRHAQLLFAFAAAVKFMGLALAEAQFQKIAPREIFGVLSLTSFEIARKGPDISVAQQDQRGIIQKSDSEQSAEYHNARGNPQNDSAKIVNSVAVGEKRLKFIFHVEVHSCS